MYATLSHQHSIIIHSFPVRKQEWYKKTQINVLPNNMYPFNVSNNQSSSPSPSSLALLNQNPGHGLVPPITTTTTIGLGVPRGVLAKNLSSAATDLTTEASVTTVAPSNKAHQAAALLVYSKLLEQQNPTGSLNLDIIVSQSPLF